MSAQAPWSPLDMPPGQPSSVSTSYGGIEYHGEMVAAPAWDPALGQPLQGDSFFRIVFLQDLAPVDPQNLRDARIAVCVPSRSERQRGHRLEVEQRAMRELRARYTVPGADKALLETQRQAYASGTVVSRAGQAIPAEAVFEGPVFQNWASRAAQAVLAWTYPALPLNGAQFPRPLSASDAPLLFRGLVQPDSAPEAVAALEAFGPGLGLPLTIAAGGQPNLDCPVFHLLRDEVVRRSGSCPTSDLYQSLAHMHGLPYWLVSLYLLVFLYGGRPLSELHLRGGHQLRLRTGAPYTGVVLVPETVSDLEFTSHLDSETHLLRYASPASWNAVSLYFSRVEPSLKPQESPAGSDAQASRLMDVLASLQLDLQHVEHGLSRLSTTLDEQLPEQVQGILNQVDRLSKTQTPDTALQTARQLFHSPQGLSQAMGRYQALRVVGDQWAFLARTARYIAEALVPDDVAALALQRRSLLAILTPSQLTTVAFSLPALEQQVAAFKADYLRAYVAHHDHYRAEASSLVAQLHDAQPEAGALQQLNTIIDLGSPVQLDALAQFHKLASGLSACPRPVDQRLLDRVPRCRRCNVALGQRPPAIEVSTATKQVQRGLRQQNQRLSQRVVQRILDGPRDERLDRFIQVVQASDLSGLVNVLDARLVAFVQEVLRGP